MNIKNTMPFYWSPSYPR